MGVKSLKIKSCLDCPHHGIERDPSSGDSFDWQDESLVCYKARKSKQTAVCSDLGGYPWKAPARRILGFSRNPVKEYAQEKVGIPKWCPL